MSQQDPAERLERDTERMEEESDRVGQRIDDARRDWESKEQDSAVPGAQADSGEEPNREESDQLPEQGPGEQVPDDQPGEAREDAGETPGVPGEDEQATGNPDAAGSEDPDEEE